jgi:hypothetical protein
MSHVTLSDILTLTKTNIYSAPGETNAFLPKVWGDMSENSGDAGLWTAPCLNVNSHDYCLAGHPILSEANGNVIRCFDRDGTELTNFTTTTAGDYEGQGVIAYVTFPSDPGNITVQCLGAVDDTGALLTNPIDVIFALLGDATNLDPTSFAIARNVAESLGYTCAGVMLDENPYQFWLNAIAASFLMDWYVNGDGKIVVRFDTGLTTGISPVAFFVERETDGVRVSQYVRNLVNQVQCNYAVAYESDKRYSEGARSNYRATDDGADSLDAFSQARYGIRLRELSLDWTRSDVTVHTIQARLVEKFGHPLWLVTWPCINMKPMQAEKGDCVVFSSALLRDSTGNPLVNQFGKVIEKDVDLDAGQLSYILEKLNMVLTAEPDIWDGACSAGDGGSFGGDRDMEAL